MLQTRIPPCKQLCVAVRDAVSSNDFVWVKRFMCAKDLSTELGIGLGHFDWSISKNSPL